MRLVILAPLLSLAACASVSNRPTDLQPAVVVSMEQPAPARATSKFDECLDQALVSSPGLVPQLAQNCCLRSGNDPEVQSWCQRHIAQLQTDAVPIAYREDEQRLTHWNWLREASLCMDLLDGNSSRKAITIQCRIAEAMRSRIGK